MKLDVELLHQLFERVASFTDYEPTFVWWYLHLMLHLILIVNTSIKINIKNYLSLMLVLPITHPIFTWSSPRNNFVQLLFCVMNLMKRTGQRTRSLTSSSRVRDYLNAATSLLLNPVDLLKNQIVSFKQS